jgi:hypothetical protein
MSRCPTCGEIHDLSGVELACDRPEAYFAIPETERDARIIASDAGVVIDPNTPNARFFRRGVLVLPIIGDSTRDGFGWGLWVEVTAAGFARMVDVDDSPTRALERPFLGRLANELPPFPGSFGLRVLLRLQPLDLGPLVEIVDDDNALGRAQRTGVFPEDVVEWVFPVVHPRATNQDPPPNER